MLAYLIRFEGDIPPEQMALLLQTLPWIVLLKIAVFAWIGLYRGMWRYTSIADLVNIITATVISAGAIALALVLVRRFEGFSRSVLILDALITLMLVGGIRLLIRVYIQKNSPGELLQPRLLPLFQPGP